VATVYNQEGNVLVPVQTQGSGSVATPTTAQTNTATSALQQNLASNPAPSQAQYAAITQNPAALQKVVAAQYGGATPAAAAQVGNTQIGPTSLQNINQVSGIANSGTPNLSSNATIQQLLSGFQPQITEQNGQLAQQLAQFGLSGGPAIAAQNNLSVQQGQAEAPAIAQAIQNSQANQLNQSQFGSTAQLNALNANQGAVNTQNQNQATLNQQAGLANQSATNSQSQLAAQLAQQAGLSNQDATNTANTANAGAYNSTLAANTSAQNASQQAYLNQLQSQWLDQFSAFNSINDAGVGAQNTIATQGEQNFGTPSTADPFSNLSSGLSSIYAPKAAAAPVPATA
jgi:hypothetical protein